MQNLKIVNTILAFALAIGSALATGNNSVIVDQDIAAKLAISFWQPTCVVVGRCTQSEEMICAQYLSSEPIYRHLPQYGICPSILTGQFQPTVE